MVIINGIIMFNFVDKFIEKKLKKRLHKRREKIVKETIAAFKLKHNPSDEVMQLLLERIDVEAKRVFPMVDQSIIVAFTKRAKVAFWITAISGVIIVGLLGGFTAGTALPFVIPVCSAVIAWLIGIVTIPINYNRRVQGAMDSVIENFEDFLKKNPQLEISKFINNSSELNEIKAALMEMNIKVDNLGMQVQALRDEVAALRLDVATLRAQNVPATAEKAAEFTQAVTAIEKELPKLNQHFSMWQPASSNNNNNNKVEDLDLSKPLLGKQRMTYWSP